MLEFIFSSVRRFLLGDDISKMDMSNLLEIGVRNTMYYNASSTCALTC